MQLDDQAYERIAKYFQLLAEPMRLKILNGLRDGAYYSIVDQQIFDLCGLVCGQLAIQMSMEAVANESFLSAMQSNAN